MRKKLIFILLVFSGGSKLSAQYFQYSQYNFTQQRINPAMIGLTRYATASFDYRHQKTGGDFAINSNFLSLTYPLLNSSTGQPWSGIGISLHNDQSGGIFKMQEAAISYAIHVRLSRVQTLSFGMKGLYQVREVSLDGFYTGSQYVPDRGFDPSHSTGENFADIRSSLRTFSAGVYWQETDRRGRLLHHLGLSLFDLNKPQDSFFGSNTQLSSTFVFNGGFQVYNSNDFAIFPEALLTYSASNLVLNAGARFQKELNAQPRQQGDRVELLLKYVVKRSGIIGLQLHRENFSIGLSYDFPVFYRNIGNVGAFEVGLELRKLVPTRAQKISAKRKKAAEEKEKQLLVKRNKLQNNTQPASQPTLQKDSLAVNQEITSDENIQTSTLASDPEALARAGNIKQEPLLIEKVTLHFSFEFNSADLDDEAEQFLEELSSTLRENETIKVKITGHTDNIGSDKFNLRLSQKRADAVKQHLIKTGIAPERLTSEGKGMNEPLNENLTDDDRAKNRRVEITIYH